IKPDDHRAGQQRCAGPRNPALLVMNACGHFVSVDVSALARRRRGSVRLLQLTRALITAHLNSLAADLDLDAIGIQIGGKTVEVCCDECARKLKEAHASAAAPNEGPDMDGDKMAASDHDEQRRIARPGAALLTAAMVIGLYLSAMTPARADTNARVT